MRIMTALLATLSISAASPPPAEERRTIPVRAPCLTEKPAERGTVVTWWIEDKRSGKRRGEGRQVVRFRC